MVRCRTNSSALVYIPARINDEPVQLLFATGVMFDCFLYESYATDRALPVSAEGDQRFTQIETLSVFGRTVTNIRIPVWGEHRFGTPPLAGFLFSKFFDGGALAIDASVPAMAFATSRDQLSLGGALSRLALDGIRVTIDGRRFMVDYAEPSSVTPQYLGDKRPGRHGRIDLTLSLAGGVTVTESVPVRPTKKKIVGKLGADLLCRWINVFDFAASELLLFPYD